MNFPDFSQAAGLVLFGRNWYAMVFFLAPKRRLLCLTFPRSSNLFGRDRRNRNSGIQTPAKVYPPGPFVTPTASAVDQGGLKFERSESGRCVVGRTPTAREAKGGSDSSSCMCVCVVRIGVSRKDSVLNDVVQSQHNIATSLTHRPLPTG